MEQGSVLFWLSGCLAVVLCGSREYIVIREYATWAEAQQYCRQNYMDLATVQTDEDWSQISQLSDELQFYTWIGLYDDVESWRWSLQDESVEFVQWDFDQPNNLNGRQYCVTLRSSGFWWDEPCHFTCPFFCQSRDGRPVLVTDPATSWSKAQEYCREKHTDLFTVRSADENEQLSLMISNLTCAWIGLFRDSWKWSDQSAAEHPSSLPWAAGQPDNSLGRDACAALDHDQQIADENCFSLQYFLCHTVRSKQQVLRLEVKAGDDGDHQAVAAALLKKVQQKLREQGMEADVKVWWREQPDGAVYQKMKSGSTDMNKDP